jgi:hypothetical protein
MAAAVNCFVIEATGEAASGLTPYPFLNTTEIPDGAGATSLALSGISYR